VTRPAMRPLPRVLLAFPGLLCAADRVRAHAECVGRSLRFGDLGAARGPGEDA
jgi:hypothetical protein